MKVRQAARWALRRRWKPRIYFHGWGTVRIARYDANGNLNLTDDDRVWEPVYAQEVLQGFKSKAPLFISSVDTDEQPMSIGNCTRFRLDLGTSYL